MSDSAIGITAIVGMAGWWRWWTMDTATLYRRMAHRLLAQAAGIDAKKAAVRAAMEKRVELL